MATTHREDLGDTPRASTHREDRSAATASTHRDDLHVSGTTASAQREDVRETAAATQREDLHDQSIGELLKRLSQETSTLVRQELELAKAEATQKGKEAGLGAGLVGGGGIAALLALGALTAAIILALDLAMAGWLAALIVAVVYAAIAGALAISGRDRFKQASPPVPEQTIETVKEDARWAKTRARSAAK